MKYDDLTINKLRGLSILDVADKLGFKLKGLGDEGRRALCPYHDDKHPSLHFSKKKGIFKCFVCGAKGDLFKLVMDARNCTFVEACDWLVNEFHVVIVPNTKSGSTNTNLTNNTNKKFSNSQIPDPEKKNSSDSSNSLTKVQSVALQSCSGKTSVSSVKFSDQGTECGVAIVVPKITSALCPLPSDIVTKCLSLNSEFCKSVVSSGYLSKGQLRRAAARYRLGATKDGGVIFWQIDDQQRVHTGKIMYYQPDCHRDKQHHPTWVHCLMKDQLPPNYEFQPCLFGLHLLSNTDLSDNTDNSRTNTNLTNPTNKKISEISAIRVQKENYNSCSEKPSVSSVKFSDQGTECGVAIVVPKIAIVESEKSAVILSEKFTDFVWLSCGGLQSFRPELLAPLVDYKVVIFPDTDSTGDTYRQWSQVAIEAQRLYKFRYPLRVSPLLESHATPEQKQRKIDLVDYLYEACDSARTVSCSHEHCRAQADSTEGQHESNKSNE